MILNFCSYPPKLCSIDFLSPFVIWDLHLFSITIAYEKMFANFWKEKDEIMSDLRFSFWLRSKINSRFSCLKNMNLTQFRWNQAYSIQREDSAKFRLQCYNVHWFQLVNHWKFFKLFNRCVETIICFPLFLSIQKLFHILSLDIQVSNKT